MYQVARGILRELRTSLNTRFLSGFVLSRMIRHSYITDFYQAQVFFIVDNRQGELKTVRVD